MLIPNPNVPLLQMREFRRALCYGIDSESIVRDILLAGQTQAGFTPLSGPFPAGSSLTDPVAYAYNPQVSPRPFEPRLAALLAETARKTLAKKEAEAKKKEQETAAKQSNAQTGQNAQAEPKADATTAQSEQQPADDAAALDEEELPPPEPLVLAHSTDPLARLACQTIKLQLDAVGIPIRLIEFHGKAPAEDVKFDLVYAEAAMWEPLTDARRLLGRDGLAGRTSPLMAMALDQLAVSQNWNQALTRLKEIHRIAHYDLPVVPLWQTVNYFAHRKSLEGVGEAPVTLYQNLPSWRKAFE
jgi:ABC-type transport system substrate-binding protein